MAGATDDAQVMTRYASGDVAAFQTLYARHKGPLYRYFFRQFGNPDTADELFQDAWTRIVKLRERSDAKAGFTSHLYRVAHNCLVEHLRKAGRPLTDGAPAVAVPQADESVFDPMAEELDPAFASSRWSIVDWEQGPADASPGPEAASTAEERASRLRSVLDALPIEQREVFLLHEEAELGLAEIAAVTGANAETVKSLLRDVVKKLRMALGDPVPATPRDRPE